MLEPAGKCTRPIVFATHEPIVRCPAGCEFRLMLKVMTAVILCGVLVSCTALKDSTPLGPKLPKLATIYDDAAFDNDWRKFKCLNGDIKKGDCLDVDIRSDDIRMDDIGKRDIIKKNLRNQIIYGTMLQIDNNYRHFADFFYVGRGVTEVLGDMAEIGMSTAGTLTGGEALKAILHASVAALATTRLSVRENFFKQQAADIILNRMSVLRANQRAIILGKLGRTIDEYSIYEAFDDLVVYYGAGTVRIAFQDINLQSGLQAEKSQRDLKSEIDNLKKITSDQLAAHDKLIQRCLLLSGDQDRENIARKILENLGKQVETGSPYSELTLLVATKFDLETISKIDNAFKKVGM